MRARDVASGPNGSLHKVHVVVGENNVVFDDLVTVDAGEALLSVRMAVDGTGRRYAVAVAQFASYAIVVDEDGVLFTVPHGGRFNTAITGLAVGAEVYGQGIHNGSGGTTISVYSTETGSSPVRTFFALYGSQGILGITGYTSILSSSDPSTFRVIGGVQGYMVNTLVNGWSVMQTEDNPPVGGLRVSSPELNGPTSQFIVKTTLTWDGYTNMPTTLATGVNGTFWIAINDPDEFQSAPDPEDVTYDVAAGELPGTASDYEVLPEGTLALASIGTFGVAGLSEEVVVAPEEQPVSIPVPTGVGRLVHPVLGTYDYEVKPDEWVNVDADAIVAPIWSSARTLTSAASVLWPGHLRDVVAEERWKSLGGLAMPIEMLRELVAIFTTPVDPDEGYVTWSPSYHSGVVFKVLPIQLTVGKQGMTLDDVVHYQTVDGEDGWVTQPVTLVMRLVERV